MKHFQRNIKYPILLQQERDLKPQWNQVNKRQLAAQSFDLRLVFAVFLLNLPCRQMQNAGVKGEVHIDRAVIPIIGANVIDGLLRKTRPIKTVSYVNKLYSTTV